MGFFDELGKKVADAGQTATQKAKSLQNIAHLNAMVGQEENKINNAYIEIGKLYVAAHKDDADEEFAEMVNLILQSEEKIRNYKNKIQDIKGVQRCPRCGAQIPKDAAFCSVCGLPIKQAAPQTANGDYVRCPNCGNPVKKGSRFCTNCGQSLNVNVYSESIFEEADETKETQNEAVCRICPNCGAKLEEDSDFCTECGAKLKE